MRVTIADKAEIAGTRRTPAGFLVADAKVARTGVYQYGGAELGRPDMPIVRVYRGEDVVFSDASLSSFAHKPITLDHPPEDVTADNWRDHARGWSGDTIVRDGDHVRVPMMVTDAAAISALDAGKRELSAGYDAEVEFTSGTTPNGELYDARMIGVIDANHIAIVDAGRAGSTCRIGDSWNQSGATEMTTTGLVMCLVDGLQVSTTDAGKVAIDKLAGQLADANTKIGKLTADLATATTSVQAKDGEIAVLNSKLKDAEVTPAKLQTLADARAKLIDMAKRIAPAIKVDGVTDAEIKRLAVSAAIGDAAAKGLADAAIDGAFVALAPKGEAAAAKVGDHNFLSSFSNVLTDGAADAGQTAFTESVQAMRDAWKTPAESAN